MAVGIAPLPRPTGNCPVVRDRSLNLSGITRACLGAKAAAVGPARSATAQVIQAGPPQPSDMNQSADEQSPKTQSPRAKSANLSSQGRASPANYPVRLDGQGPRGGIWSEATERGRSRRAGTNVRPSGEHRAIATNVVSSGRGMSWRRQLKALAAPPPAFSGT